ncbi:hypothetical protein [Kangiella sp. M94]
MKTKLVAIALAGLFSGSALASDLSYDSIELGYSQLEMDDFIDMDGLNADLTISFTPNWYISADTVMTSGSESGLSSDIDFSTLNVGFNTSISNSVDFIAELGAARYDVTVSLAGFGSGSDDDNAANAVIGFRGKAGDVFEWGANVNHMDFDDSLTFLNLEGRFFLTDTFSLGAKASIEDDMEIYSLTARFDF